MTEILNERSADILADPFRKKVEKRVFLAFLLVSVFSFAFAPGKMAWGVAFGAGIAFLSFRDLKRTLEKGFYFLLSGNKMAGGFMSVRHYIKLGLISVMFFLLLKGGSVDPVGLAIGLTIVPASLIYTAIASCLENSEVRIK